MSSTRLPALVALLLGIIVAGGATVARAQNAPVKPYVLFILDTSGSMDNNTQFGNASCVGAGRTRIDHAKCAVQNVANNYGDMVMGLGRFRQSRVDDTCGSGCVVQGTNACPATVTADSLEVIVPIVDDNQADLVKWTDFSCGGCSTTATDPELYAPGNANTPLEGSLDGAKLYWQGADSPTQGAYWTGAGDDPVRDDPLNNVFTSPGNQCRPYITILMTDGDETCHGNAAGTGVGANALLTTDVDGQNYKIVTKVIGFGQAAPYQPLEDIAHAGGTADDGKCSITTTTHCTVDADCPNPQTCNHNAITEAYYAQNQEDLELAMNQIIADAIKFEVCNGIDDDCDTQIDEDFNVDQVCHDSGVGACQGTGVYVCNTAGTGTDCSITQPGGTPTTEVCNGIDDNCNGLIDEGGVCNGCTGVELCDGNDNDCDTAIDEDLSRTCGTDVGECVAGVEVCQTGGWVGCTAIGPTQEQCDGLDNDCDGTVDGFAQACYDGPAGTDNVGECHDGNQVCNSGSGGVFGPCIGEQLPVGEVCDGLDNDCDGSIDEDTGGVSCSSNCGLGVTECVRDVCSITTTTSCTVDTDCPGTETCNHNAQILCDSQPQTGPDLCDGIDSDCDMQIDEDAQDNGPCSTAEVCNGTLVCQGGVYVCVGTAAHPELCNCLDDDCDNQVDEDQPCSNGSTCVPGTGGYACQCAEACEGGEFPCPQGRVCVNGFCLVDPCVGVSCGLDPNGDATSCVPPGICERTCDNTTCPGGQICYGPDGLCHPDDCTTFPDRCNPDELCVGGTCVANNCTNVPCTGDQYCVDGECHDSCAGVDCAEGEQCVLGQCVPDPCGHPCPANQYCDETSGSCMHSNCGDTTCPTGETCDPATGICGQDPCLGVTCPGTDQVCSDGSCYDPSQLEPPPPDAGEQDFVTAAGGGGCDAAGGGSTTVWLVFAAFFLLRKRGGRS